MSSTHPTAPNTSKRRFECFPTVCSFADTTCTPTSLFVEGNRLPSSAAITSISACACSMVETGTDTADHLEHARVATLPQRRIELIAAQQEPEVDRLGVYRKPEITRRDADDGVALSTHRERLTYHARRAVEVTLPKGMTQHDLPRWSARAVDADGRPQHRPGAQQLEEAARHDARTNLLWFGAGESLFNKAPAGQPFQRATPILPVTKIGVRGPLPYGPSRVDRPHHTSRSSLA
jgi:hypothetical protein